MRTKSFMEAGTLTVEMFNRAQCILAFSKDDPDFPGFEKLLTRNIACLANRLGQFVGRMSGEDRDDFIERTVWQAWYRRDRLNARQSSLLSWFTACIKEVAESRSGWVRHYSTHSEWVPSKFLGGVIQ